jgi:hypothetical protein
MPPTEIRTQDLPGSEFIGPMDIPKNIYESCKDDKSDDDTVKLVDHQDEKATVQGEEDKEKQGDKEDDKQTTW